MDTLIKAIGLLNEQIANDPSRTLALCEVVDLLNEVQSELEKVTPLKAPTAQQSK